MLADEVADRDNIRSTDSKLKSYVRGDDPSANIEDLLNPVGSANAWNARRRRRRRN